MGFKKTSDIIAISFEVVESAPSVFTSDTIALQLDVLNNEIFVCLAVDLNLSTPEMITNTDTSLRGNISSTEQTAMVGLEETNCIAETQKAIRTDAVNAVPFQRAAEESYSVNSLDYIGIISTNNFHASVQGTGNTSVKSMAGRLWGYRAKADASTYAALVQSEVLSA